MKEYVWALLNLILAIAGVLLIIVAVVRIIISKNNEQKQKADEYNQNEQEEQNEKRNHRLIWIIITILLGIIGMVFFLITEDITKLMVLADRWTIVNAIIFIFEIVGYALTFKRNKEEVEENEETYA